MFKVWLKSVEFEGIIMTKIDGIALLVAGVDDDYEQS